MVVIDGFKLGLRIFQDEIIFQINGFIKTFGFFEQTPMLNLICKTTALGPNPSKIWFGFYCIRSIFLGLLFQNGE